jgi:undecaprenyl phosphate-alpha-L-ara4N flippase subunit ArnF
MAISTGLFFAFLTALLVIAGDTLIKVAADRALLSSIPMASGVLLYMASAVCWFYTMRHAGLAEGAVAYSMLTLVALCVISAIHFDEPIGPREALGLLCALAAMWLMSAGPET